MILVNDVKEHNNNMMMEEEMPTNLTKEKPHLLSESEVSNSVEKSDNHNCSNSNQGPNSIVGEFHQTKSVSPVKNDTKNHLNFSVARLLGAEAEHTQQFCDNSQKYNFVNSSPVLPIMPYTIYKNSSYTEDNSTSVKTLIKPTPIRAIGNAMDTSETISSPFINPISLMRFHGIQQAKQKSTQLAQTLQSLMTVPMHHGQVADNNALLASASSHLYAMNSYQFQNEANFHLRDKQFNAFFGNNSNNNNTSNNHNNNNYGNLMQSPNTATSLAVVGQHNSFQKQQQQQQQTQHNSNNNNKQGSRNVANGQRNNSEFSIGASNGNGNKRKRSWSRAVFSNLQRKGLEIQFQQQKYITKPDRRKLAARLNLTDAQVKVWFQNRRMKWRHTRENLKSGQEKIVGNSIAQSASTNSAIFKNPKQKSGETKSASHKIPDYSSDGDSSIDGSQHEDNDDGDIDVVE